MAELRTETEVEFPSKQLFNVVWNRGGIEVPLFVGLGVSKFRQQLLSHSEYSRGDDRRHHDREKLERQLLSVHMRSPTTLTPEHQMYTPRPVFTRAGTTTALHGTEVYFSVSSYGYDCPAPNLDNPKRMPHYVWKYNCVEEECSVIECLSVHDFGLVVVNEQLVAVGGETDCIIIPPRHISDTYENVYSVDERDSTSDDDDDDELDKHNILESGTLSDIATFDLNKTHYGWQYDIFPAMSEPRKQPAVIGMKQYLVVAGGQEDDGQLRSLVEVLNTESKVWSQVTSLPEPVRSLTAALCGNQLYFLGGFDSNGSTRSVFTCPVESIKEFCDGSIERAVVWQKACDTPLFRSTCVVHNDDLFVVGGRTSTYRPSSNIYCYDSNLDSWKIVDQQLPTPRSMPIALTAKNKLVVIGGLVQDDEPTDIVEIGTCISGMLIA